MAAKPGCIISDLLVALGPGGATAPTPGLVQATPSVAPLFVQQSDGSWQEIDNAVLSVAASAGSGSWSLTLPSQANCDPSAVTWTIALPDGTKWNGPITAAMVTASQGTPLTLHDLKATYGWALVNTAPAASLAPFVATATALGMVTLDQNPTSGNPIVLTAPRLGAASGVAGLDGGGHVPLGQLSGLTTAQLAANAGIVAGQIASVNPSALTGSGTVPLGALSGITAAQLDPAAGIGFGQIASVAASAVIGSHTLADGVLSANVPLLNAANVWTNAETVWNQAPTATPNFGLISLGPAPFDGASAGHFAGSGGGTILAANAASGFAGNLVDLQVAGSSKFKVSATGATTLADTLTASSTAHGTASFTLSGTLQATNSNATLLVQKTATMNGFTGGGPLLLLSDSTADNGGVSGALILQILANSKEIFRMDNTGGWAAGNAFSSFRTVTPAGLAVALAAGGALTVGTPYFWVVTALDSFGNESAISNEVTATPTSGNQAGGLTWNNLQGAMGYNVYRSTASGNYTNATRYTVLAATGFNDTGAAGTTASAPTGSTNNSKGLILSATSTQPTWIAQHRNPTASAAQSLNLGSGPFDGASAGHFAGSAFGTILGINAPSGYQGTLIDVQLAGAGRFKVDPSGNVTMAGTPGFSGAAPVAKPTITGSRGGNAALASLLTALAATGLLTDSTTA